MRLPPWADLEAAYALAAGAEARLFGAPELELVHLRGAWERPSFEVGRDHWVATEAGGITGYADVSGDDQVTLWLNGPVGAPLLQRVETRAVERGAERLYAVVASADEPACHAFAAAGYAPVREVWRMHRSPSSDLLLRPRRPQVELTTYEVGARSGIGGANPRSSI